MTADQTAKIAENLDALTSWLNDFDKQRREWNYPQGIEARLADQFELIARITASLRGLMLVLSTDAIKEGEHLK